MNRFLKGIIVGFGGISPGLSGSVLLIIFGLYRKTLDCLGLLLRDFKNSVRFLLPLVAGMILGVLLFSNLVDFLLEQFEVPTRFCFLGLIVGTLPTVWREVKKEGISLKYIVMIILSALLGLWIFTADPHAFPTITQPTLLHCVLLGVAVAATAIIPGVDPAIFLSTFGLYEVYVDALASLNLHILLPMVLGLAIGAVGISAGMSWLFKRCYTATYSVIFGLFLSMIPNMLTAQCALRWDGASVLSVIVMLLGFIVSVYLGDMQRINNWIRAQWSK